MIPQWTFGRACLVVPVYVMVGWENIMYEFGDVSFLVEASVDSLPMGRLPRYIHKPVACHNIQLVVGGT
jgi:hypothetical protein